MASKLLPIVLVCAIVLSAFAGGAGAVDSPSSGIWLQAVYSGHQAWAYYPYDPVHPFVGGAYCPINNGTSYFTVAPGTTIWRKYIVINNQPNNDSVSYVVTGIPAGWGLSYTKYNPLVLGVIASNNNVGTGAGSSKQGFGTMVVSVPASAAPGKYTYTIMATSGTGYTSNLTDSIIVGTGGLPTPTLTPTPTSAPTSTPTPTPSPAPSPGGYSVTSTHRWANYNGIFKPLEQFNVAGSTTVIQSIFFTNTGANADSYTLTIAGIPASWYKVTVFGSNFLSPGESRYANAAITPQVPGIYPITVTATSNNDTSISSSQAYTLYVATAPGSPTPGPTVTPTPTPAPTPIADNTNLLYDPGFENGYINTNIWVGSKQTNYKNDQIIATSAIAHSGKYSIVGAKNDYSRAAQNVTYGGHGFEFSAWFYVDPADPTMTSIWAGVLSVDAGNRANLDNLSYTRMVGYNNRSWNAYHDFQYEIGGAMYTDLSQVSQSGWYKGVITYDGNSMTLAQYDHAGNLINSAVHVEPGFIPRAVAVNAASMGQYLDDLSYVTW